MLQVLHRLAASVVQSHSHFHVQHDRMCGVGALSHLAITGARARAVTIVPVIPGADDRAVADAPWIFPPPAARADAARNISLLIYRDDVHRAMKILDARGNFWVIGRADDEVAQSFIARTAALDFSLENCFRLR